jgi:hypothetical protein
MVTRPLSLSKLLRRRFSSVVKYGRLGSIELSIAQQRHSSGFEILRATTIDCRRTGFEALPYLPAAAAVGFSAARIR